MFFFQEFFLRNSSKFPSDIPQRNFPRVSWNYSRKSLRDFFRKLTVNSLRNIFRDIFEIFYEISPEFFRKISIENVLWGSLKTPDFSRAVFRSFSWEFFRNLFEISSINFPMDSKEQISKDFLGIYSRYSYRYFSRDSIRMLSRGSFEETF